MIFNHLNRKILFLFIAGISLLGITYGVLINNLTIILYSVGIFLGSLLIYNPIKYKIQHETDQITKRILILFVLNFILITVISIILIDQKIGAPRSNIFFILLTLANIILFLTITLNNGNRNRFLIYAQLFMVFILETYSLVREYPQGLGIDPFYHEMFSDFLISTGHIPSNSAYSGLPLFHIIVTSLRLLSGLDYLNCSFVMMSSVQLFIVLPSIVVVISKLSSTRIAPLAVFILINSALFIEFSWWIVPNAFAVGWIILVVCLHFNTNMNKNFKFLLIIIFIISIIITNTIASVCLIITLSIIFITDRLNSAESRSNLNKMGYGIVLISLVLTFSWWVYASGHISNFANLINWGFSRDYFYPQLSIDSVVVEFYNDLNYFSKISPIYNLFVVILISTASLLIFITDSLDNRIKTIFTIGAVLSAIGVVPNLFGVDLLIQRWLYIGLIFLAPINGLILYQYIQSIKKAEIKFAVACIIGVILTIGLIINPAFSMDRPDISGDTAVEYGISEMDDYFLERLTHYSEGNVFIDDYYTITTNDIDVKPYSKQLYFRDLSFVKSDDVIIIRDLENDQSLWTSGGLVPAVDNHDLELELNLIFNTNDYRAYSR